MCPISRPSRRGRSAAVCGAPYGSETWARFVRGPGAGRRRRRAVDAAFGPEPAGPFSSVFFDRGDARRAAARRPARGCNIRRTGAGLFWTAADEDADDAATAGSEAAARGSAPRARRGLRRQHPYPRPWAAGMEGGLFTKHRRRCARRPSARASTRLPCPRGSFGSAAVARRTVSFIASVLHPLDNCNAAAAKHKPCSGVSWEASSCRRHRRVISQTHRQKAARRT